MSDSGLSTCDSVPGRCAGLGISGAPASQIYDLPTGWPRACIQRYCSQRPPGGDGAAISGVHRHVGLLQERPGGIGVISKYPPASARTSSSAPLCPSAPPALGREFRFQKAMMALAPAEIPPISGVRSLSGKISAYSSVSQSVFPGPDPLQL